ncbi:hypothetical protein [Tolypothrix tenuis]
MPKNMVTLPKYREEIPVQFGVRITNQASIPYRFDLPFILPEILDPHGQAMHRSLNKNATREVENSDIPIIIPGESFDFLMDAKFDWYGENYLRFLGNAIYGGIWIFWYSQPGKYQVRFTYENQLPNKRMLILKEGWAEIDGFWIGKLISQFADLILFSE